MKETRNTVGLILTGILLVALAASVVAEKEGNRKNLDTNEDGFISQTEWNAVEHRGRSTFADFDADADGRISEDEFRNRKRKEGRDRVRDRS